MRGSPDRFWGKLDVCGDEILWHPLHDHSADVAACFVLLLQRTILRRRLAALAGIRDLDLQQVARLTVLAALHDVGKHNAGFQARAFPSPALHAGHVQPVLDIFGHPCRESGRLADALGVGDIQGWCASGDGIFNLLIAAIAHHGKPALIGSGPDPGLWRDHHGLDPFRGIASLVASLRRWLPDAFSPGGAPLPVVPAFQHALTGLVTLADWLGSDPRAFPYTSELDGDDRFESSLERARVLFRETHLDGERARSALGPDSPGFSSVSPHVPRAAQAGLLGLPTPMSPSITVLEAETGSGKTEAALAWFLRLFHAGEVDGMYFALPTRTAATQIHSRVVAAMSRAVPDIEARPPVVLAVPGYLSADEVTGRALAPFHVLWNDDDRERFRYRYWAAEHPKRFLAGAVVVGTIDQVLLSGLTVAHSHLRAAGLLRHLLVVDEVHASDTYMNRLLEAVLARHCQAGGHALLMSATLGSATRERLMGSAGNGRHASDCAMAYPAITQRCGDGGRSLAVPVSGLPRRIGVELAPIAGSPGEIATRCLAAASAGARVLVIRNTVRDCVSTQESLEADALRAGKSHLLLSLDGTPVLHHSRFARTDRLRLDARICSVFADGHGPGVVAVGTQTVQQSLDLDADLMLSDLCPMDVLLQRAGRLHRHASRVRPAGFEDPRLVVLVQPDRGLSRFVRADGIASGPHGIGTVYGDLRMLEATWRELERREFLHTPADCRELVERTTRPDRLALLATELGDAFLRHEQRVIGKDLQHGQQARLGLARWDIDLSDPRVLFPSGELDSRIRTRLGEGDRRVSLPGRPCGPFGGPIDEIEIPEFLCRGVPAEADAADIAQGPAGFEFQFGDVRFRYDRFGLRRVDSEPGREEAGAHG